jgi:hypothetical protein
MEIGPATGIPLTPCWRAKSKKYSAGWMPLDVVSSGPYCEKSTNTGYAFPQFRASAAPISERKSSNDSLLANPGFGRSIVGRIHARATGER